MIGIRSGKNSVSILLQANNAYSRPATTTIRHFGSAVALSSVFTLRHDTVPSGLTVPRNCLIQLPRKWMHANSDSSKNKDMILPSLMNFNPLMWPRFMNTIRNWFFTYCIIKPYFDREFNIAEFCQGAREAISVISNKLSEGQYDDLEGLVESDALEEIKKSLTNFSVFQRELLKVASEDIFFLFPYQIGVIIPDDPPNQFENDRYVEDDDDSKRPPQTRHVEITVVCHVLRGLNDMRKNNQTGSNMNFQSFIEDETTKYNVMVCNYRFLRDFTKGTKDHSWIVNMVNQYLPADYNSRG